MHFIKEAQQQQKYYNVLCQKEKSKQCIHTPPMEVFLVQAPSPPPTVSHPVLLRIPILMRPSSPL